MLLIKLLKEDDNKAFSIVFNKYHHALYGYILKKTHSKYLSEEIVQLTFFKLWKYRHSLNEDIPLINQLFRIARTSLINELKKEQNAINYKELKIHDPQKGYEHIIEDISCSETQSKVIQLVDLLPPMRKKVFEMSRFKHMSNKEISIQLCISTKTVENHITLALKSIKPYFTAKHLKS